jgi:Family of unknown function (DUF695)
VAWSGNDTANRLERCRATQGSGAGQIAAPDEAFNMAVGSDVRMWATAVSTNVHNGRKIIFRYAKEFGATVQRESQPIRVIIVWKYQSESGQPFAEDHQRMNLLEDTLESVLKDDGFATLALVSTGEYLREWTYYARSEIEFMARVNYALAEMPAFPIETHIACDPTWDMYQRFRADIKEP